MTHDFSNINYLLKINLEPDALLVCWIQIYSVIPNNLKLLSLKNFINL